MSGPLVEAAALRAALSGPEEQRPTVLDVRYRLGGPPGRPEYRAGHVPTAAYVDLDRSLAGIRPDGGGGRHPMPDPAVFAAAMRAAGVRTDRPVVVYDDWSSVAASRLWWLLGYHGKNDVAVLDGGWAAWLALGGPVQQGEENPPAGDFRPRPGGRRLLDAAGAARCARDGLLLDVRSAERYRGEAEPIDPVAGHIPGARNAPALANVGTGGRLRPAPGLAALVRGREGAEIGIYCGSGLQATHAALVLEAAGMVSDPGVYVGSWSDWIRQPEAPVATGTE